MKRSYFIIYHYNWLELSKWNIHILLFIIEADKNLENETLIFYHLSLKLA